MENKSFGGNAALPGILHACAYAGFDRRCQVGIRKDNECIAPAEFKDGLLDVLTRFCSHGSAGAFTSRKCHSFYYRVRYDSWDLILVDDKALKCPHRKARFNKDFLNVQSTAKNVGCVFQHTNVTRHQGRRRETEDLPEGEVPRHNGEDGSERI